MSISQSAGESPPAEPDRRPIVLSIAGFDPSSGAGVTADLKVFEAHRLYGMACITALTVQSTLGVRQVEPLMPATVAATLQTLAEDVTFAGIKIGMLANRGISEVIDNFLGSSPGAIVVLDPVLRSSSGRALLEPGGIEFLREKFLRSIDWIAPNREELAALVQAPVPGRDNIPAAAARLREFAQAIGNSRLNIVVTGGDFDPPEDFLLACDGESRWLSGERVVTDATHGTGCAFSSALLCGLVAGKPPLAAAAGAKEYVAAALRAAYPVGRGKGPMNHLFALDGK